MSASTRPQPRRSWRRQAWRTRRCERPLPELGGKSMASKTSLALVAVLSLGVPLSLAQAETGTSALPGVDPAAIEDLVLANRILANEKVLDGFGHVSIRDPRNPGRYLMSRSIAPATVTADDIMEYDLDSKPVDAKGAWLLQRAFHPRRDIKGAAGRERGHPQSPPDHRALLRNKISVKADPAQRGISRRRPADIRHSRCRRPDQSPGRDACPRQGDRANARQGEHRVDARPRRYRGWTQCEAGDVLGDLRRGECAPAC